MPFLAVSAVSAEETAVQLKVAEEDLNDTTRRSPKMSRIAILAALSLPVALSAQQPDLASRVDRIFARFDRNTPGCAVGVARDGKALYTQGYGSANLEYRVPLTDSSVMESGSVAKQFTAAAMVLLQQDGKLSIDDDIRKYLPEVPDFGKKITIRNLLTHTSGLRDQWGLLGLEGRGPGSQVHSPATTLDLVVHQKMLNFAPGSEYLYSNTGYALSAIIIERVSGKSLQEFTQERLFKPLGMTHTQWRDDFTRVVPNRATAYAPKQGGGWVQDMPFTNMVGNGGILTTMGDLVKWNENLDRTTVGGPSFTPTMQTQMKLNSGRTIPYALGLENLEYDGVREVAHGGSTAGYRTYLARYPDQHVAISVWCSNASVNATQLAHQVADLVLTKPQRAATQAGAPAVKLSSAELAKWAGTYRDPHTDQVMRIVATDSSFSNGGRGGVLSFNTAAGKRSLILARPNGDTLRFEEVKAAPAVVPVKDYAGTYGSDELDARFTLVVRDGKLFAKRRPADEVELRPTYADAFTAPGIGSLRFSRGANGRVNGFAVFAGRVLDVRFRKLD
jgi:CubicO group peptidase (beta-lactamase class C family)